MSGFVFVWIVDPLLRALHNVWIRAAMESVVRVQMTSVLKSASTLPDIRDLFMITEKSHDSSLNLENAMQYLTGRNATCMCREFAVVPACKYLHFWIGPGASVHMNWKAAESPPPPL